MISVVCIAGDGVGLEVTPAMKAVVAATGAPIQWIDMPAGLGAIPEHGDPLPKITIDAIAKTGVAIKGPTNTPKGFGHGSVNVRLRKLFDLYVGYRPCTVLPFPGFKAEGKMDLLLFRQNTEGLYAHTEEIVVKPNGRRKVLFHCEFNEEAMLLLARAAFQQARATGRKSVTVVTKSNIHKGWGLVYKEAFMEVARDFPEISAFELLVDDCARRIASSPAQLSVIVTENLFGDILSDECAGKIGGLGVAPGANLGETCAIFESVHGSADDIAGQDKANPTALILSAAMLLDHIRYPTNAMRIRKAVDAVVREGKNVTGDVKDLYPEGTPLSGTKAFAAAVCEAIRTQS